MSRPLPFPQLTAFEASARHLSFTAASRELNVQQPAVSRQVAMLEAELGTQLFQRTKPRLTLTTRGEILFQALSEGFAAIQAALKRIRDDHQSDAVIVATTIGFASLYLIPRLAGFLKQHPNHPVQIVTRDQNTCYEPELTHVIVDFGEAGVPGSTSARIFGEQLIAVCAPSLLKGGEPYAPEDLPSQPLLHMSSADHADDWQRYLKGTGIDVPTPLPTDRIMSFMVYHHSIQGGQGIGLGWRQLVEGMIADGRLAVAVNRTLKTHRGYHASLMPQAQNNESARVFWTWLLQQHGSADDPNADHVNAMINNRVF